MQVPRWLHCLWRAHPGSHPAAACHPCLHPEEAEGQDGEGGGGTALPAPVLPLVLREGHTLHQQAGLHRGQLTIVLLIL